jgi:nucleotidyltransferase/DNA polymerase involved in DNA repair
MTKTLAKIGSKYNKPNGICITLEDNAILDTTPIESVWGIGRSSTQRLISLGINTAYKFASMNAMEVSSKFNKPLQEIWHELNGCIQYKVHNTLQRVIQKSYETTRSFSSYSTDKGLIFSELSRNVEIICKKLRENFLLTNNIIFSLKVVTDDGMLAYKSREVELPWHTDDPSILLNNIVPYFDKIFKNKIKCKSTGISVHNLLADKNIQRDFFQIQEKNIEKSLYTKIIDEMENKFGKNTIYLASSMQSINKRDIEDQERREKYPYEFDLPLPYMGEVS